MGGGVVVARLESLNIIIKCNNAVSMVGELK